MPRRDARSLQCANPRSERCSARCRLATLRVGNRPRHIPYVRANVNAMMKVPVASAFLGLHAMATAAPLCHKYPASVVVLNGAVSSGAAEGAPAVAGAEVTIYPAQGASTTALPEGISDGRGQFSIALPADGSDGIRHAVARRGESVALAAIVGAASRRHVACRAGLRPTTLLGRYPAARVSAQSLPSTTSNVSPAWATRRSISRSPKSVAGVHAPPALSSFPMSRARQTAAWPSIFAVEP